MRKNPLIWILVIVVILIISQVQKPDKEYFTPLNQGDFAILTSAESFNRGKEVKVTLQNNTDQEIVLPQRCPNPPLEVYFKEGTGFKLIDKEAKIDCQKIPQIKIAPKAKTEISFVNWNHALFATLGRYQLRINLQNKPYSSNEFSIKPESTLSFLWKTLCHRPIYNTLIFLIKIMPYQSLGLAIIFLTIIIRTLLLIPSQRALKSQKKLQEIQPKLEALKKKYAGNQQKIAEETMKIWKEHKVNPFGSCLPILFQFPILIALFYVIKDGLLPDYTYLLYSPLQGFSLENIDVYFLGLDLTKANLYLLPVIIGLLQFLQIKLQFALKKKPEENKKPKQEFNEMETVNNVMMYFMPVMVAVFTASVPAGVGLYWGISTLYGIGQQIVVNKGSNTKNKYETRNHKS